MKLRELAAKYSCDKLYAHSYIDTYAQLFEGIEVKRLLEIGIGYKELMAPLVPHYIHGASLRMWQDFFPRADIFSCDLRPDTLINEGRIRSVVCDQYNHEALVKMAETFGGNFDVIIDDGCHHTLAQTVSFFSLWPYLRPGGIYIVEDVGYPDVLAAAIHGDVLLFRKDGRWDDALVIKRKDLP